MSTRLSASLAEQLTELRVEARGNTKNTTSLLESSPTSKTVDMPSIAAAIAGLSTLGLLVRSWACSFILEKQ